MSIPTSSYLQDLIVPLSIIAGALVLGILIERLLIRFIYRAFEKRDWKIGRRLIGSFNGIVTIWFGLAAFRSVLHDLPIKASAFPAIEHITSAVIVLSIAVFLARIAVAFIRTYSNQHERAVPSITLIENIVRSAIYLVGILAIFHAFGVAVAPLLTALGVGGLAVALALQDTLSNFFAGVNIILSKHIDPGDYVKLDSGQEGTIRDIAWRVTTIQTPSDTLIIVPNSKFSTSIITNFDRPEKSMNLTIELPLDQATDSTKFEAAALAAAQEVQKSMPGITEGEPSLQYTAFTLTGATLQLVIRVTDFSRAGDVRSEVLKRIFEGIHPHTSV
jgi:small-conductance mechanosensitive channel